MKYLYLDGSCGISGDMTVAALLDLGADRTKMDTAIESLHLHEVHCHVEQGKSYAIAGLNFSVHDHHHHADEHAHEHHHEHRHLSDAFAIIDSGNLTPNANALAKKIFDIIAEAESKAHGVEKNEVHFHEVGAIDSIVDIVAAAVLIDDLQTRMGISQCIITGLNEGQGFIQTQHGLLPIPCPAVSHIAESAGIALHITATQGEMVTPTGAGIVAAIRTSEQLPASFKILKSGIGLGKRDFGRANFLRAQIHETIDSVTFSTIDANQANQNEKQIFILESNIDDSTGEELGFAMDRIFEAGARDAHYIPCYMKKNRPGVLLRVITDEASLVAVEQAIFKHTSTVGICRIPVKRTCMDRTFETVQTNFGPITIKNFQYGNIKKQKPEFDSVATLAKANHVSIREITKAIPSQKK